MAMIANRMTMTIAVAGLTDGDRMTASHPSVKVVARHEHARVHGQGDGNLSRPPEGGLDYMKEDSVTVGRAGRLSVHALDERALGMRGTECPPSCMHRAYRPRRVVP